MKNFLKAILFAAALLALIPGAYSERLVILHTNDTHSNIEPDAKGVGGILQRKTLIDSVRKAEKNVLLIDAGDMVQGSLYFKFFRGDVEYPLFNMMDYDIRILGNHEFDNGLNELANHYKGVKANALSANYDFKGTAAEGLFKPYVIKKVAGKKIGFIGLNVDPASLISKENYEGMGFKSVIETGNALAAKLKNEDKCDLVVAVTHIGYRDIPGKESDMDLARASQDIDIIIGGHSHTTISPDTPEKTPYFVENTVGNPVLIAQTGKYGRNLGYINIDLEALSKKPQDKFDYRLIPVTDRFDSRAFDKKMAKFLEPYRQKVDSVNRRVIAKAAYSMNNDDRVGGLANFTADMAYDMGRHWADSIRNSGVDFPDVDMAIMNVGGIRLNMPKGDVTEGQILSTYPFSNHIVIVEEKGSDIIEALAVAAAKGGESVSNNVRVLTDPRGNLQRVILNGEEMNPEKKYVVVTIDYVAEGNDDLTSMANGRQLWRHDVEMSAPVVRYIEQLGEWGLPINPDSNSRFVIEQPK